MDFLGILDVTLANYATQNHRISPRVSISWVPEEDGQAEELQVEILEASGDVKYFYLDDEDFDRWPYAIAAEIYNMYIFNEKA